MKYRVSCTLDIDNDAGTDTLKDVNASVEVDAASLILAHNDVRKKLEGIAAITRIDVFAVEELAVE
jgi:hypothetical protein